MPDEPFEKANIRAIWNDAQAVVSILRREKARAAGTMAANTATEMAIEMAIRSTETIIRRCEALLNDDAHNGV